MVLQDQAHLMDQLTQLVLSVQMAQDFLVLPLSLSHPFDLVLHVVLKVPLVQRIQIHPVVLFHPLDLVYQADQVFLL